MKKAKIFFWAGLLTALFASCNKYEVKTVQLNDMRDSINYALGLANGAGIKQYFAVNDTTGKLIPSFIKTLNNAYSKDVAEKTSDNELFELGKRIGNSLKKQNTNGLMGDTALVFNEKLALQGLINGLNNFDEGMTTDEAKTYFQTAIQERRKPKQPQSTTPAE